jgi:putative SOS response-associated peptidase YedK
VCGRFYVENNIPADELRQIIDEVNRKIQSKPEFEQVKMPLGEIFPTNIVPVIAPNKEHIAAPYPMQWGFTMQGKGQPLINARAESVLEKPIFRKPVLERRCRIPATNYFEWEKQDKKKIKHALRDPISQVIYMAGIYRYEADKQLPVFVILTRDAASGIRFIHDRMPVILPKEAREAWVSDSADISGILSAAMDDITAIAV